MKREIIYLHFYYKITVYDRKRRNYKTTLECDVLVVANSEVELNEELEKLGLPVQKKKEELQEKN